MAWKYNPFTSKQDYYKKIPLLPDFTINFDTVDPNTPETIFTPNDQLNTDAIYVSSVNDSLWTSNGITYQTYIALTAWYLNGTTIDAGSSKTANISRTGNVKTFGDLIIGSNGKYLYGVNSSGISTRMIGINGANALYIGSVDANILSINFNINATNVLNIDNTGVITTKNYKLPLAAPTAGQVLGYLGAGTTTWVSASGGSGVCGIANSSGVYTYYATLNLAITAAVSGQTVDLLTDITETGSVSIATKTGVKINGNGYTYTLSVNDDTQAIVHGSGILIELYNIKVVRTGRAPNLGGRVYFKNDDTTLVTIRCQNVVFENTYGVAILANFTEIYGLNIKSYGSCIIGSSGIYNCNLISSAGLGIENVGSGAEVVNCNVTSSGTAIKMLYGNVYNSVGRCSSGVGIYAFRVINSMGISVSDTGISTTTTLGGNIGYNCVGISTSGVGLSGNFTNSTGISTSGYAGANGTKTNCTLISSSNYASFQENLNNCYLESTTNVPLWTSSSKLINTCTAICLWNNAGGHAINTTSASTGVEIRSSSLSVTNASAYCINGASGSTFKYAVNTYKGSTIAVNTTNVTQGITNTSDNQGNILI